MAKIMKSNVSYVVTTTAIIISVFIKISDDKMVLSTPAIISIQSVSIA